MRLLFLFLLLPTIAVLAQTPTPTQPNPEPVKVQPLPEAEVDALVVKLGADDPSTREVALRQLEAAGVRALPGLRKAINHPDAEVRRVLVDLVPALEMQALLAPKRVTLKMEGKSIQDALNEIAAQTGYKIQAFGGNIQNPGQTFRLIDVPFWEAIDHVAKAGGLTIQQGYGDDTVRLQAQDIRHPHASHDGSFRVIAQSMNQSRTIDLQSRPGQTEPATRTTSMVLNLTVFSEPKLPIIGYGEVKLTHAMDSERNSMVPPSVSVEEFVPGFGFRGRVGATGNRYSQKMFHAAVNAQLVRPSEKAGSIKILKGYIPLTLLTEQKSVEITKELDKANNLKKTIDSHTFTVQEVKENPAGQWQVKMIITNDSADNDYSWGNSFYQRLEVYGPAGEKLQNYGSSWGNNGPNLVNLTMTYRDPAGKNVKPTRLAFQSWTTASAIAPFEFRDVPLP